MIGSVISVLVEMAMNKKRTSLVSQEKFFLKLMAAQSNFLHTDNMNRIFSALSAAKRNFRMMVCDLCWPRMAF